MIKRTALILGLCTLVAACADPQPRIIQPSADASEIRLEGGMATEIELPEGGRVQSAVVGNEDLLRVDHNNDVVNLMPKDKSGETNLIVRSVNKDGDTKVYQYRVIVQGH